MDQCRRVGSHVGEWGPMQESGIYGGEWRPMEESGRSIGLDRQVQDCHRMDPCPCWWVPNNGHLPLHVSAAIVPLQLSLSCMNIRIPGIAKLRYTYSIRLYHTIRKDKNPPPIRAKGECYHISRAKIEHYHPFKTKEFTPHILDLCKNIGADRLLKIFIFTLSCSIAWSICLSACCSEHWYFASFV